MSKVLYPYILPDIVKHCIVPYLGVSEKHVRLDYGRVLFELLDVSDARISRAFRASSELDIVEHSKRRMWAINEMCDMMMRNMATLNKKCHLLLL